MTKYQTLNNDNRLLDKMTKMISDFYILFNFFTFSKVRCQFCSFHNFFRNSKNFKFIFAKTCHGIQFDWVTNFFNKIFGISQKNVFSMGRNLQKNDAFPRTLQK